MLFSFARACARGTQCVVIVLMQLESRGGPALAEVGDLQGVPIGGDAVPEETDRMFKHGGRVVGGSWFHAASGPSGQPSCAASSRNQDGKKWALDHSLIYSHLLSFCEEDREDDGAWRTLAPVLARAEEFWILDWGRQCPGRGRWTESGP